MKRLVNSLPIRQLADEISRMLTTGIVRKARSLKLAIDELLSDGLIELSHPENLNDRRQTYRLSPKGEDVMKGR